MRRLLVFLILGILLINFVFAACTVTLDKEEYVAGETATAAMSCSINQEKNTGYTLTWANQTGYIFETDSGTTPPVAGQMFYESFAIPSTWPNGIWLNATLNGTGLSVTQNDSANVTALGSGGTNTLEIINTTFGGGYLGLVSSVKAIVTDENGKKITGGVCKVSGLSNDETKVLLYQTTTMFNGHIEVSDIIPITRFDEATDYAYKIDCYCGSNLSGTECIDEDGNYITGSLGTAKNFFTTNTWLTVNTVTDKLDYTMKNEIFICANVTNVNYSKRIHIPIHYQVRCSAGMDNNDDLDRILIIDDPTALYDERGINANTTQMQCKKFVIPELKYLQGKTSQCYASTEVEVFNQMNEPILSYHTTSPIFNITSTELNLDPDWQWIGDKKINSIVNLSDFTDINGTGTGDIDVRLSDSINDRIYMKDPLEIFNIISNISVYNITGLLVEHVDYELEFLEDGQIEIEIRNVSLTKTGTGWYNITLEFYDLNLRQTEALEGIENKTGTFHLDVNCPATGTIGREITCTITAYVEDTQLVQKEVDFTCYITDGLTAYSSVNFNQMITRNAVSINRDFAIPSTFGNGQSYVLQCHADYYNLGSRRDSFYDTFTANRVGGGGVSEEGAPITGGIVDEEGKGEPEDEGMGDIFRKFNPFSPDRSLIFVFMELLILIGLVIFILSKYRKIRRYSCPNLKRDWKKIICKVFLVLLGIAIVVGLMLGAFYGYKNIKESVSDSPEKADVKTEADLTSYSILQDKLFRAMLLTAFIVLMLIILFKALHLRGEIRFGKEYSRNFYEDKKSTRLQQKLNQIVLKNEIRKEAAKEGYKVRKISGKEFRDLIK